MRCDRGLAVQVAYLVNHYDWQPRPQELLDALWTMGIRNYPVIGPFPDYYVLSLEAAQQSFGEENVIAYQVGLLRRFKPLVAVGHDREGEYGHGAHRLNALALEQAVVYAADASYDVESAAQYGVWDTPKLYLHFADENPIILDVETPLESFGGKTAFEVASEAMLLPREPAAVRPSSDACKRGIPALRLPPVRSCPLARRRGHRQRYHGASILK